MIDDLERWRVVVSSWAIVLVFFLPLTGISTVASLQGVLHPHRHLARALIPQHDACSGPGLASAPGIDGCETVPLSRDRAAYW